MITKLKKITTEEMIRNWAIAEASNSQRHVALQNMPKRIEKLLATQQFDKLTPKQWELLEKRIKEFRSYFFDGLLKLNVTWYKGHLKSQDISHLEILKWPDFLAIAQSRKFLDLVIALENGQHPPENEAFITNLERISSDFSIARMSGAPILVASSKKPPYYLIEGFTRCSAILMNHRKGIFTEQYIPVIIGVTDELDQWYHNDDPTSIKYY